MAGDKPQNGRERDLPGVKAREQVQTVHSLSFAKWRMLAERAAGEACAGGISMTTVTCRHHHILEHQHIL